MLSADSHKFSPEFGGDVASATEGVALIQHARNYV